MRRDRESQPTMSRVSDQAYVLFASVFAREFYAVVPTHCPIPAMLLEPGWRFVCILKGNEARQPGLRRRLAADAVDKDGAYLFCSPDLRVSSRARGSHFQAAL